MTDEEFYDVLRQFSDNLYRRALEGSPLSEIKNERDLFLEYSKGLKDADHYVQRRVNDVIQLMYLNDLDDQERAMLYDDFVMAGFDDILHEFSVLWIFYRESLSNVYRERYEEILLKRIIENIDNDRIIAEISYMPNLIEKAFSIGRPS